MKCSTMRPALLGVLFLVLRFLQNRSGFDPATGLTLPSLPGTVLAVAIVLDILLEFGLALRLPRDRRSFPQSFRAPAGELPALVLGSMFLVAGGALHALKSIGADKGVAGIVTGALALCAGAGILVLTKQLRSGAQPSLTTLLPALFFSVFFVLAVYLPSAGDPVLARFYLPVLASSVTAYAFSQLSGFFREESSRRSFTPTASCAVSLCLAALADGSSIARRLLFMGCAVVLAVFLVLQRQETAETDPHVQE